MIGRRRPIALLGACMLSVLVLVLAAPAGAGLVTPNTSSSDPSDDFLANCDPSSPPRPGVLPMDVVGARFLGEQNGALRFQIAARDDVAAYFATNPPSAAFEIAIVEKPGGRRFKVGHELHAGRTQDYVKLDDKPFNGSATMTVDQGLVAIVVTGLPPMSDARWSVTSFNEPDPSTFVCDKVQVGADGAPLLTLPPTQGDPTASTTTSTTAATPATNAASADARTSDKSEKKSGGGSLVIWGALFALLMFGVFFGLAFRQRMHWRDHDRGSHGAPPTPPPGGNDFGE